MLILNTYKNLQVHPFPNNLDQVNRVRHNRRELSTRPSLQTMTKYPVIAYKCHDPIRYTERPPPTGKDYYISHTTRLCPDCRASHERREALRRANRNSHHPRHRSDRQGTDDPARNRREWAYLADLSRREQHGERRRDRGRRAQRDQAPLRASRRSRRPSTLPPERRRPSNRADMDDLLGSMGGLGLADRDDDQGMASMSAPRRPDPAARKPHWFEDRVRHMFNSYLRRPHHPPPSKSEWPPEWDRRDRERREQDRRRQSRRSRDSRRGLPDIRIHPPEIV